MFGEMQAKHNGGIRQRVKLLKWQWKEYVDRRIDESWTKKPRTAPKRISKKQEVESTSDEKIVTTTHTWNAIDKICEGDAEDDQHVNSIYM